MTSLSWFTGSVLTLDLGCYSAHVAVEIEHCKVTHLSGSLERPLPGKRVKECSTGPWILVGGLTLIGNDMKEDYERMLIGPSFYDTNVWNTSQYH
jgi:hypothetical protein